MPKRRRTPRSSTGKGNGATAKLSSGIVSGPKTIAVDFDGMIADYDGWKACGVFGAPRGDVVAALRGLHAEGWKIIVHTTRGETEISAYLLQHGIPHHEVNRNSDYRTTGVKPVADVYWDDRAFRYLGDARRDILEIRRFRTWSGRE